MKIIAKITYILLACVLLAGCLPVTAFAEQTAQEQEFSLPAPGPECFKYTLNEDKTAVITAYSGKTNFVAIPDMIDGYRVVAVASKVFAGHTEICRVDFGNNVKRIESGAFEGCTALEEIILPNSVEFIGASAFAGCTALYHADVGSALTSLGAKAFSGCVALESIALPSTLTSLGDSAFDACAALRSVIVASTDVKIPGNAFSKTSGVTVYALEGAAAHAYTGTEAKTAVAAGGEKAFATGSSATGVTVTALKTDAKAVIIPDKIGGRPVSGIQDGAFSGKTALEAVYIPDSVKSIGKDAFSGDASLKYVRMPRELIGNIANKCFADCYSLTQIYIPSGVETVGTEAFLNCSALNTVTFPEGLSKIQLGSFYGASSLKRLIFKGSVPTCAVYNGTKSAVSFGSAPADMKIYAEGRFDWDSVWYANGKSDYAGYTVIARTHDCFYVENTEVVATCTAEGRSVYACRGCGAELVRTYPMTDHVFVSMGKSDGVEAFRCTGCVLNYIIKLLDIATVTATPDLSESGADILENITVVYRGTTLTENVDFVCEREYLRQYERIMLTVKGIGEYGGELVQGFSALTGSPLNSYTLTVNGASGSGTYYRDDRVTLVPDTPVPEGMQAVWTCDNGRFIYKGNDSATFEMPAKNVTVTLSYEPAPETTPPVTTPPETEPPVTTPPETQPPETEPPVTTPPETIPPQTETRAPETTKEPYSHTDVGQSYLTKAMIWAFVLFGSLVIFVVLIILTFKGSKKQ